MKRHHTALSALLLLLCLSPFITAQTFTARVLRAIDGDTIVVVPPADRRSIHVRLAEIDAPEHDQPWGPEATQFTASHVAGRMVYITGQGNDAYGRTIAHVATEDGWDLNTELLRAGLAWWYRHYSMNPVLGALELEARRGHRGLWADPDPIAPWDWRHSHAALADTTPRTDMD